MTAGGKIKATDESARKCVFINPIDTLPDYENHFMAARALQVKMGWAHYRLISGRLGKGKVVFVMVDKAMLIETLEEFR
jgi:hypothetical protein